MLPPISYPAVLSPCGRPININARIMAVYLDEILPGAARVAGRGRTRARVCAEHGVRLRALLQACVCTRAPGGRRSWCGPHLKSELVRCPSRRCACEATLTHARAVLCCAPALSHSPAITEEGDDGNYGSAATLDVLALQALSSRIHYGKFVAEAKFRWA